MDEETGEIPEEPEEVEEQEHEEYSGAVAYYRALRAVQERAPRVIKAGDAHFQSFKFAPEKVYEMLLIPIFLDEGLVVELAGVGPPDDLELATKAGGIQWMTTLECIFRITHFATGYIQTYRIQGRRTNDSDKGVSQAISSASKSFWQYVAQVREDEDPDSLIVESSTSSKNSGRGRQVRRTTVPQGALPKAEKPPTPPKPTETPAQRLELAKEDIKHQLAKNRMRVYHLEALANITPNLPAEISEWGLIDYEMVQEVLQTRPNHLEECMKESAKEFPTSEDRTSKLNDLHRKVKEQNSSAVDGETAILIASAIQSGWSDAVEFWINKLTDHLQGQQEADV